MKIGLKMLALHANIRFSQDMDLIDMGLPIEVFNVIGCVRVT